jgi:hypothetical protein
VASGNPCASDGDCCAGSCNLSTGVCK